MRVAVVGSGFAGSLLARVLAVQGHDVVLLERGTHPRFAIGESSTPLANLTLERLARRYGLDDCYDLAAHGRWVARFPELRRGLKRGFTFYRHHAGRPFAGDGTRTERLLVAASPNDHVADNHWLRADVDHYFVRAAIAAGVEYHDRVEVTADLLKTLHSDFVVDGSGPGGFLARQLAIPSALHRMHTRAGLLFSHFDGVRLFSGVVPGLPAGPYPDDWAAVHHIIDEGWMYSLRFDHGATSAGFLLRDRLPGGGAPEQMWQHLLRRYPTIGALFGAAKPLLPLAYKPRIQHRLTRAAGPGWAMLPHAYAFVDPLYSTGIAWSLRAIERLGLCFENGGPTANDLARYDAMLSAEADQIDLLVAGAYHAMARFELFAAHSMIYFAAVSFAEVRQRLLHAAAESAAWSGFLGVGDPRLGGLPRASLRRLRHVRSPADRLQFVKWVSTAIAPRNVCGLANRAAHHCYPVDLDVLVQRHAVLGMSRESLINALPALRGGGGDA
ncbi:MAG TPA: FAD-dependent oxidoreductase [Gemmatimonadales bacterium]|nr:FAD-dependent oxidoreductase [Gemmatimonadales bacterium]